MELFRLSDAVTVGTILFQTIITGLHSSTLIRIFNDRLKCCDLKSQCYPKNAFILFFSFRSRPTGENRGSGLLWMKFTIIYPGWTKSVTDCKGGPVGVQPAVREH